MDCKIISLKIWIIVAAGLFIAGLCLGMGIAVFSPALASMASPFAADLLEQLSALLADSKILTATFIFANNAFTLVMSFIFSPVLCLVPVIVLVVNGGLIGFISPLVVSERSLAFLLTGLLPHGIIEMPALILGEAAALSAGITVIAAAFGKIDLEQLMPRLKRCFLYLAVAIALLLPAALIEAYLTPMLLA